MTTTAVPRATFALALLALVSASEASAKPLTVGTCAGVRSFATIQAAVAAAAPGDTVRVCPGVYAEQVEIDRPLTLRGIASGTLDAAIIVPPAGGLAANASDPHRGNRPIAAQVLVRGTSGVVLTNLAIDGRNNLLSACDPELVGVLYQNASGSVRHLVTRNQLLAPGLESCQSGIGVLVLTDDPNDPSVVELRNNAVHTYQVGGIVGNFAGTQLTVRSNSVVGLGLVPPATRIFQNGIQLAFGARGVVSSNTVVDNSDPSGNRSSSAILVFGATVAENRAGNSDTGVALFDTAVARGNRLFGDGRRLFDGIYVCGTGSRVGENVIDGSQESGVNVVGPAFGCPGTGHVVRENTVNEGCAGVLLDTGTSGNTLAGNACYNVTNTVASGSSCGAPFAAARPAGPAIGVGRPGPRAVE